MRRLLGAGLVVAWSVALVCCGLVRYFPSPWAGRHLSLWLGARLGAQVRVGSVKLSADGFRLSGIDARAQAFDLSVEEVDVSRADGEWITLIVRPAVRLKDLKGPPPSSALRGRAEITGLRALIGERELGPFKGSLGPDGLDLYCSDPVPVRLKGPPDDLRISLGPVGLKPLLGATGRFALTARRSRDGLAGKGELTIAKLDLASWAALSEFSGGLRVSEGPGVVLEQRGEAKVELAGTLAKLRGLRAEWTGGPVEGEAALESGRGSWRVQFAARFLAGTLMLERVRVEGDLKLPVGEGFTAAFRGAAEGWAEFLPVETRAEIRMPKPVSLELVPEGRPPSLRLSLGGRVGLKLVGTGERTELSGRVEGLTVGGLPVLGEGGTALSFDFSLSKRALVMEKLRARGGTGWEGRGEARLGFEGPGALEGVFELRDLELVRLCKKKATAKLLSPGAKVYRVVSVSGPLGALRVEVKSGAYDLDFEDKKLGLALRGIEVDVVDEAVIDLGR